MAKLISENALVLRKQYKQPDYLLTHYASQNFHNAITVSFISGEEFLVVLNDENQTEIFQDIDFLGGNSPKLIFTLPNGPLPVPLNDKPKLNQMFTLKEIKSECHILQYDEKKLPEKKWYTRTSTRNSQRGTAKHSVKN